MALRLTLSVAALALASLTLAKAFVLPHVLESSGRCAVYDITGGYLANQIDLDPKRSSGWAMKHISNVKWEDISMAVIPGTTGGPLEYVMQVLTGQRVKPYDFTITTPLMPEIGLQRHETGWMLKEVTVPACDGSSKEAGYLRLDFDGGISGTPTVIPVDLRKFSVDAKKQKAWLCSNFRIRINGLDCTRVNKIESFSIKQSIADLDGDGSPDFTLDSNDLCFSMPSKDAAPIMDMIRKQQKLSDTMTGELRLLATDGGTLNTFTFHDLLPVSIEPIYDGQSMGDYVKIHFRPQTIEMK